MDFSEKIKGLRTKAQESQAANKIIDMLKALESKNDSHTAFRWVWELIQNAKDVPNSSGKVDIEICFDESQRTLEFKHNGRLFSTKNIIFLIEQVSTKDRDKIEKKEEKTTGKFGTGFLTTHLLSKKVTVSGYIKDDEEPVSKFSISLDRSSGLQKDIISSIENSCNQLETNSITVKNNIDEKEYNTCFKYDLDEYGISVAKEGINNLIISAPFVFTFVPKINSIKINARDYTQIIERSVEPPIRLANSKVISTSITKNGIKENRFIVLLHDEENNVEIAVEVEQKQGKNWLCSMNEKLPKLYCDFPLLGTDDFAFPVVVNCRSFNPTEPRNGIFLTVKEDKEDSDDVKSNKYFILLAVELYKRILDYFVKEQYKGIYNIVKINEQPIKDWISVDWVNENIIEEIKAFIRDEALVENICGECCSLIDEMGNYNLLIPTHENKEVRLKLWELASRIYPNRLPQGAELEDWYHSLWEECRNFTIEDLIDMVENIGNLANLEKLLGSNCYDWLKEFYRLIYNRDYGAEQTYLSKKIVPNQNGDFCEIEELRIIEGIDYEYYEIAIIIDIELKNQMVDKNLVRLNAIFQHCEKYNFEALCNNFKRKLLDCDTGKKDSFYRKIICLKANAEYSGFVSVLKDFYEEDWTTINVKKTSTELSTDALEFWIKKTIDDITNLKSVENLSKRLGYDNSDDAINWLNKFFSCFRDLNKFSLLINEEVFPTQNGNFRSLTELYIDSGEIAEETKDILNLIGNDIRNDLFNKKLLLQSSRAKKRTNEEIAAPIINYIKANQKKLGDSAEEKAIFQGFYRYLRANEQDEAIKKVFDLLYSNLHWFYNDEDIAANMQKVEAYDLVLSKYGVEDIKQLESILSKSKTDNQPSIEITSKLLAQWGITSEKELNKALQDNLLGENFIYTPAKDKDRFNFVQEILQRAKTNIMSYLDSLEEYDVSNVIEIAKTVFLIRKNDEEIYLIPRPSDYDQVVIYYNSELDVLDYEKDCELWVENGIDTPAKLTFGKILKLTGVNKIPLRGLNKND